jgi:hypothetical protein
MSNTSSAPPRPGTGASTPDGDLIELLAFPRHLLRGGLSLEEHACVRALNFHASAGDCAACDHAPECDWLCQHDEAADVGRRSREALEEAVGFAVFSVDAEVTRWGHDQRHCRCETCTWLRRARKIYDAF